MNLESVRQYCLSLPHTTEIVQWQDHLLMKVGGKMFAILALEPGDNVCSLRTTPESYFELMEREGFTPASHNMWKYQWVSLERYDVIRDAEWRELLRGSYDIIYASLPAKVRAELEAVAVPGKSARRLARKRSASAVTKRTKR